MSGSSSTSRQQERFRSTLAQLLELPIVGDLRGAGYFYALELVRDKETGEGFSEDECEASCEGSSRSGSSSVA